MTYTAVLWRCTKVSGTSEELSCPGFRYLEPGVDPGPCTREHVRAGYGNAPPSVVRCGGLMFCVGEFEFDEVAV